MTRLRATSKPMVRVFIQFIGNEEIQVVEKFRDQIEKKGERFKSAVLRLMKGATNG